MSHGMFPSFSSMESPLDIQIFVAVDQMYEVSKDREREKRSAYCSVRSEIKASYA